MTGGQEVAESALARLLLDAARLLGDDGLTVSSYGQMLDASTFPPLQLNAEGGMQSEVIRSGRPLLTNDVARRVEGPGEYYDADASGRLRKVPDEGPPDAQATFWLELPR